MPHRDKNYKPQQKDNTWGANNIIPAAQNLVDSNRMIVEVGAGSRASKKTQNTLVVSLSRS